MKRKSWNNRYGQWRWDRAPGKIYGPDPWSSLTSGGYVVRMDDGRFVPSTDAVVEHPEPGEQEQLPLVQQLPDQPEEQVLAEAPRRRLRFTQPEPRIAMMELVPNSGEKDGGEEADYEKENQCQQQEKLRLQDMHQRTAEVLSQECQLIDDLDMDQMASIPTLAMLAHQKYDLEQQLRSMAIQSQEKFEEENFLVTKTVTAEQVYREWPDWTDAMRSEYDSIVVDKRAVRQLQREDVKKEAVRNGQKYEELPSKVVFTRKAGGKRKVRACICGNFEQGIATETYAGGCDAAQIRSVTRHAALKGWKIHGTDIKCA